MTKEQLIQQGLTDTQADAVLALHKSAIDGHYVPKTVFEAERNKVKALNETIADRDKQIKELGQFKGTAEQLQSRVAELEKQNKEAKAKYEAEIQKITSEAIVRAELISQVYDPDDVLGKLDFSKIIIKDGKISAGLTEQIEELKKTKPHYFKAQSEDKQSGLPAGWSIFGKSPREGSDNSEAASGVGKKSDDFGAQLAKLKLAGEETAKKIDDIYFKL